MEIEMSERVSDYQRFVSHCYCVAQVGIGIGALRLGTMYLEHRILAGAIQKGVWQHNWQDAVVMLGGGVPTYIVMSGLQRQYVREQPPSSNWSGFGHEILVGMGAWCALPLAIPLTRFRLWAGESAKWVDMGAGALCLTSLVHLYLKRERLPLQFE